jgi:hypothetical protein
VVIRMLLRTLLAASAAVLLVPTAAAEPPDRVPLPFPDATGQFCEDFQVLVHATQNNEVATIFGSGAVLVTGVLKVEVTNLETDETIALNISGPGMFSADGSTISGAGTWLLFGEAGQLPGPDPGLLLVTGRNSITSGPTGITALSIKGTMVDVCDQLGS